jgi:mono/diheme cytochrome c family protein
MTRRSAPPSLKAAAIIAFALALPLLAACSTAHRGEPFTTPVPTRAPEEALGEEVFMQHCHSCHPGGESGVAPSLHNRPLPAPMIRMQVRVGMGAMPRFSEEVISDDELDALITYLLLARRTDPYEAPQTAIR